MEKTENLNNLLINVSARRGADHIFLEILKQDASHASHILKKLLSPKDLSEVRSAVERSVLRESAIEIGDSPQMLNTGHFLLWLLGEESSEAANALRKYGVTYHSVHEYVLLLPDNEDYYDEVSALEQYSITR